MVVKSEGRLTKNDCTGPSPLPEWPWQLAQLSLKSARPKATDVCAHDDAVTLSKLATTQLQMLCLFIQAPVV
jgi:hypothetical protein